MSFGLALAGLVFVGLLVLARRDVRQRAVVGPAWSRRLVAAGLALLAVFGFGGCGDRRASAAPPKGGAAAPAGQAAPAAKAPEWARLESVWEEADAVAAGRRGDYPFDATGKKRLLARLASAAADVDALVGRALASAEEGALLKLGLARLAVGVEAKRPTEMRGATCYEPVPAAWATTQSMGRLRERLPLLARLAAAGTLHPAVVRRALAHVEQDLATLESRDALEGLGATEKAAAEKLRAEVRAQLAALGRRLAGGAPARAGLVERADWKVIAGAFAEITPLLPHGEQTTTKQRLQADARLAAAREAAGRLAGAGELAAPEAELIAGETHDVRADLYRSPPADFEGKCYKTAFFPPARRSVERLTRRLPLIKKLVAGRVIHGPAARMIIAAARADLAILERDDEVQQLPDAERPKAAALRAEARAQLVALEQLAAEAP